MPTHVSWDTSFLMCLSDTSQSGQIWRMFYLKKMVGDRKTIQNFGLGLVGGRGGGGVITIQDSGGGGIKIRRIEFGGGGGSPGYLEFSSGGKMSSHLFLNMQPPLLNIRSVQIWTYSSDKPVLRISHPQNYQQIFVSSRLRSGALYLVFLIRYICLSRVVATFIHEYLFYPPWPHRPGILIRFPFPPIFLPYCDMPACGEGNRNTPAKNTA